MEETPKNKNGRPRHTPTPKMSERKKSLFTAKHSNLVRSIIDEDSDLGPMSPLQFSSSPTSYDERHENKEVRKSNRVRRTDFKNIMKQLSPIANNQREKSTTPDKLRSVKKVINTDSDPHTELGNISCIAEKENIEIILKTPRESTSTNPRISFRKSITFDNGMTPETSTTKESTLKASSISDSNPKAKTSLSFSEISTKSFYGASFEKSIDDSINSRKSRQSFGSSPAVGKTQWRVSSKARKKTNSKSRSTIQRPVLGGNINKNGRHRGNKPKVQSSKKTSLKNMNKNQILEAAINLIDKKSGSNSNAITKEQIERLRAILKNRTNPIEARPLNWNIHNRSHDDSTDELNTSTETEDAVAATANQSVEEESCLKKRKFFKSNSSNNKYEVMKGMCATVKRGTGMILLSPKRKKQKLNEFDDEFEMIQREVTDIINQLNESNNQNDSNCHTSESSETVAVVPSLPENTTIDEVPQNHEMPLSTTIEDVYYANDYDIIIDPTYDYYRKQIPYNTNDPELQARQENLLDFLISNNICTEENFKIFITEPELHKERAAAILDQIYQIETLLPEDIDVANITAEENLINMDGPMSPASHISNLTLGLALGSPNKNKETNATDMDFTQSDEVPTTSNYYPIFCKETFHTAAAPTTSKKLLPSKPAKTLKRWKGIGEQQLQIDAGQKRFGGTTCRECGMFYTVHEPEEEMLHEKYHNSVNLLNFRGWDTENVVCEVPEWEKNGRIICVSQSDSKLKRNRITVLLNDVVHRDLGYVSTSLAPNAITYLAIAKNQIIGVCVAEPLFKAYPLIVENHQHCLDKTRPVAVKCGISRIWVVASYRRCGIATKLLDSIRQHFIRGEYTLSTSEIAFSSPTEQGRYFAENAAKEVLVYDGFD